MTPPSCNRLAEVDFPIAEVSRHAAREKSIRHGHPSTLHLWWARRPLASSRAVLMALLLPDPCDKACPEEFRQAATREIKRFSAYVTQTVDGAERLVADLRSDLYSKDRQKKQAARREANRRNTVWRGFADTTDWTQPRLRSAPAPTHRVRLVLGLRRRSHVPIDCAQPRSRCSSRRNSPCSRSLRWRRLHPPGGTPPRLRDLRQRPQPRRLSHPQGHAGGHSQTRARAR